jgi:hypothetical protein
MDPNGIRDVKPPFPEGQVNGPRTMGNVTINRMRSKDGEGEVRTVKELETLRSEFNEIQNMKHLSISLETHEIQKLEISRTQNKF